MTALDLKLAAAGLFFTEDDRAMLARLTENPIAIDRRTDVIVEGEKPEHAHVLLSGLFCRYKVVGDGRRQILGLILPGDFCDLQVGLLHEMDHSIAALSSSTFVRIARRSVDELIHSHPRIARALWWATLVDEAIMRENIAGLGQRETLRQLAHLFCELHTRLRLVHLVNGDSFALPLTQEELGDILGVSVVHANRTLVDLRAKGLATFEKGRVTIHDLKRLTAFADFHPNYLHLSGIDTRTDRIRPKRDAILVDEASRPGATAPSVDRQARSRKRRKVFAPGQGATFATAQIDLLGTRVLVAEDDYFVARELSDALRTKGATVIGPASNIEDAIALIQSGEAVDAAILDVNLADGKVFPVAETLRGYDVPMVFVTGYEQWVIPREYDDVPLFQKPTDMRHVIHHLFAS